MKKILPMILSVLLLVITTSCSYNTSNQSDSMKTAENQESLSVKSNLQFKNKDSLDNILPPDEKGNFLSASANNYEYYLDDNDLEYTFIEGTDILCGISYPTVETWHIEEMPELNKDKILSITNEYLVSQVPEFNDYTFTSSDYQPYLFYYIIEYSYFLNDIETDDIIRTIIYKNGQMNAYFMPNRGKYKDISLSQEKLDNAIDKAKKKTEGKDWRVSQTIKKVETDLYLVSNCFADKDQMSFSVLIES